MKIAFFGTPEFAAEILTGILEYPKLHPQPLSGEEEKGVEVILVVSQPDKPVGRKKEVLPTPVKKVALKHGIDVLQPKSLKVPSHSTVYPGNPVGGLDCPTGSDNDIGAEDFQNTLRNLELDFIVVVAYGKIIPQSILDIPKHGCINIHGSILPSYRGASPVQSVLRDGASETGLTTMYMNARMDEGDILKIAKIPIDKDDTSPEIFQKFVEIGPELLRDTLQEIVSGELEGTPQDHDQATYCSMIEKGEGEVSFSQESAQDIYNKFRAFQPWPGIFTYVDGKKLGLEKVSLYASPQAPPSDATLPQPLPDRRGVTTATEGEHVPGTFLKLDKKTYGVVCADKKILLLHQVKPEGKKSMDMGSFVNGNRNLFLNKV